MRRGDPSSYVVAIPSWRRSGLLARGTLALLEARGVDPERLTVFLDEVDPELSHYRDLAASRGFNVYVSPVRGIEAQRQIIASYYPPGTPVVTMCDDVTDVQRALDRKNLVSVDDLDSLFRSAFSITATENLYVWGVGAVANAYFMRPGYSTGLRFLIGTLWGFYSRPGHPVHVSHVAVKEDYESSLRAWWYDGGAVRLSDVAVKADHYKAPGGCQDYRTRQVSQAAVDTLLAHWPGLVRVNTRRQSAHPEILLSTKGRHAGHDARVPPPGMIATPQVGG
jgi:hypothetical protein